MAVLIVDGGSHIKRVSMLRCLLLVAFAAVPMATPVPAQDMPPHVDPRTRVRLRFVQWDRGEIKGNVMAWSADSATVANLDGTYRVSLMDIDRIQESAGKSAWRGAAKWGLIAAATTAAVVIPLGYMESAAGAAEGGGPSPTVMLAALGVVVVIPAATIAGAITGSERWRTRWERREPARR